MSTPATVYAGETTGELRPFCAPNRLFHRSVAQKSVSRVLNGTKNPNHIVWPSLARPEADNPASKGATIMGNTG